MPGEVRVLIPYGQKKSCSACVVLQQTAEALLAKKPMNPVDMRLPGREEENIFLALMVSLRVIVREVSAKTLLRDASLNRIISFDRYSCFTERTHRSVGNPGQGERVSGMKSNSVPG